MCDNTVLPTWSNIPERWVWFWRLIRQLVSGPCRLKTLRGRWTSSPWGVRTMSVCWQSRKSPFCCLAPWTATQNTRQVGHWTESQSIHFKWMHWHHQNRLRPVHCKKSPFPVWSSRKRMAWWLFHQASGAQAHRAEKPKVGTSNCQISSPQCTALLWI